MKSSSATEWILLPEHFVVHTLRTRFEGRLGEDTRTVASRRFARWWQRCDQRTGPATAVRTLVEAHAVPMFAILGFRVDDVAVDEHRRRATARATAAHSLCVPLLFTGWREDLDRTWRDAVREGVGAGARWAVCWNASELRIVDAARPWGRRHIGFDLGRCATDAAAFSVFWSVARAEAFFPERVRLSSRRTGHAVRRRSDAPAARSGPTLLDEIVEAAGHERQIVRAGLEQGVTEALVLVADAFARRAPRQSRIAGVLFDQSLTVIYRLLFLLFAEARALVPMWHHVYRENYSIEALREQLEREPAVPGLWAAVQAISRLAHRGCRLGVLRVTPFNGHLFAPERAPLVERVTIDDRTLTCVLESLTTFDSVTMRLSKGQVAPSGGRGARASLDKRRRVRIAFADLGVEQLGAIYERVLDHRLVVQDEAASTAAKQPASVHRTTGRPAPEAPLRVALAGSRSSRKASATFYTPRSLTDLIVRRTLAPLLATAGTADIVRLRVLDPAMGSGAFLVAACRTLARAYETALVREQSLRDHELDESDRAGFRRLIARRCLYGVDRNPTAVQLARLSLWLATLAADVPLTFLDHHLRVGNSLIGASLADLLRQAPGRPRGGGRTLHDTLPLLASTDVLDEMAAVVPVRRRLEDLPDDTIEHVRDKERLLASLETHGAPLTRWREAADLWCSTWFWPAGDAAPRGALYGELLSATLDRGRMLPVRHLESLISTMKAVVGRERFFHWRFEFPEVFTQEPDAGFDAIVGNPPWDMLRCDNAHADDDQRAHARNTADFVRQAGVYVGAGDSHANLYLLFIERALQLLGPRGRLGMVVPWGLASDQGAARVRRLLFERSLLDSCIALDNRHALFPVHRSLKFLVLTCTIGERTRTVFLQHLDGNAGAIDSCPEQSSTHDGGSIAISRELLDRVSPGSLAIPDVRSTEELRLLDRLWRLGVPLSSPNGWNARFGRELNATDDRHLFNAPAGLPVLEGKHVEPFRVHAAHAMRFADADVMRARFPALGFARARVAYRDVSGATNERTLIAGVVPPNAVTTHTLFCCRTPMNAGERHVLCALLNSFVGNWIARRWVSTHVTVALMERIPFPTPAGLGREAVRLATLAESLEALPAGPERIAIESTLQGLAARAWGIRREELELILRDFPLVDPALRTGTLTAFDR
jgi:hypothetical protein